MFDTTKLCHGRKWQIKETSQVKLVMTKVLMLRQTFQRMASSRHHICRDISNLCHDIKFRESKKAMSRQ